MKNLKNEDAFKSWIMKILFTKIKHKQKEYINAGIELDETSKTENFDFGTVRRLSIGKSQT
jgi:hypothetical protein